MKTQRAQDTVFAAVVLAIAAFYTVMTYQIPYKPGVVDGRTVPKIISALFWILGLSQLWFARKSSGEELKKAKMDGKTVVQTAVLIVLYIALFEMAGFIITTVIYLFAQFTVLTPVEHKTNYLLYGVIAVAVTLFVYTVFRYGLDIVLPQGLITFF